MLFQSHNLARVFILKAEEACIILSNVVSLALVFQYFSQPCLGGGGDKSNDLQYAIAGGGGVGDLEKVYQSDNFQLERQTDGQTETQTDSQSDRLKKLIC